MRFYIINHVISFLLVSSAYALRGSSVGSYQWQNEKDISSFAPDGAEADLDGMVDIGILSAATTDVLDQYEADRKDETILAAGLDAVFASISIGDVVDDDVTGNLRTPTLGITEGANCVELARDCKKCYTAYGYYFKGSGCWIQTIESDERKFYK